MCTSKYQTIVVDPPWQYGAWGKASDTPLARKKFPNGQWSKEYSLPYKTMSLIDIEKLPVSSIAADNCELYLWVTQRYLPAAFRIVESWGFKYCQTLTWCKRPRGLGQGGVYCPTTEFIILGRRGLMPKVRRVDTTWWLVKRPHNSHSTKPEVFQDIIESVSLPPRIELFARRERHGWDVWGNEVPCSIELGAQNTMESGSTDVQQGQPEKTADDMEAEMRAVF
jgi:N6-adenosine-specific RNA methylase IME4